MLKYGDINWFYGSKDNHFWKIFSEITNTVLDSENMRKTFAINNKIGFVDLIESCYRQNNSSLDKDLYNIKIIANLKEILTYNIHDNIHIFFTSNFVVQLFNFALKELNINLRIPAQNKQPFICLFEKKQINSIILYSPSPNALRGIRHAEPAIARKQQYELILK